MYAKADLSKSEELESEQERERIILEMNGQLPHSAVCIVQSSIYTNKLPHSVVYTIHYTLNNAGECLASIPIAGAISQILHYTTLYYSTVYYTTLHYMHSNSRLI